MTTKDDILGMLKEHEFLKGMSDAFIEQLAEIAVPQTYFPNDYLFHTGSPATACYLVRSGHLGIEIHDPSRGSVTLETIGPNKVLGWSWLVPPHKWTFDARAYETSRVIALPAPSLLSVLEASPESACEFYKRFIAVVADRLQHARMQLLDLYGSRG